ncbi:hypothetical protein [Natrinema limicola]|uniref:Uncharacterized protein n=1 Tax=Natrinema limicola JCM 13563 TaxID=1230457 RepID=M0CPP2_9EURY|nr:hypothetical protein [Natrinema limicola]ELZ25235.1 hypothetical protein C476_02307 [Natrinema limicola JCM 13563]
MRTTRSVALLVTLAIVGLTVAPVTSGVVASTFTAADSDETQSASTNASVGTMMQASAADTSNAIETELFETAYERTDTERKATLVSDRTAELEEKVAALEAERKQLKANRDQLSQGAYQSQLSRLTVQLAALEQSIERTERHAAEVGVAQDRLVDLQRDVAAVRQNTSKQARPGVAAVAQGIASNDPSNVSTGPPSERGPDTEQSSAGGPDDRPSKASPADQPSEGNSATQPSESSSADQPSEGNSATQPSESNSTDRSSARPTETPTSPSTDKSNGGGDSPTESGGSRGAADS